MHLICHSKQAKSWHAEWHRQTRKHTHEPHSCNCLYAGGVQLAGQNYVAPSYTRAAVPKHVFRRELKRWQQQLCDSMHLTPEQRTLTVDVLVPSLRADPSTLQRILDCICSEPNVSLLYHIQLEPGKLPADNAAWLHSMQLKMGHQLRIRQNSEQLGAPANRNALLEDAFGDCIIFFDDDVIPDKSCIDAYVKAFRANPRACSFAGVVLPIPEALLYICCNWNPPCLVWLLKSTRSFTNRKAEHTWPAQPALHDYQ